MKRKSRRETCFKVRVRGKVDIPMGGVLPLLDARNLRRGQAVGL